VDYLLWCAVCRSPRSEIVFGVGFSFGFDFLADAGPCHSIAGRNFSFLLCSQVRCLICFWFCHFQFSSSGTRPSSSETFILRHPSPFFSCNIFVCVSCSVAHRFQLPWEYCARSWIHVLAVLIFPTVCSNSRGSAVPRGLWFPIFFGSAVQLSLSLCLVCCGSRCACVVSERCPRVHLLLCSSVRFEFFN
jgi:hypothetical protein